LLFLLNIRSLAELESSPLRGPVFETAVYCELRKRLGVRQELESLFFFRDRSREVDFVLHRGGRFELMECKWTEVPNGDDVAGMDYAARVLGTERIVRRTLVCRTSGPFPLAHGSTGSSLEALEI
jgi:predicted AAA+ superfamily ATPase